MNYTKDFAGIVSNRNTRDYEMLMQWSKVFLLNKNFTTFSGDTAAQSLLFPMELVYESYVAQQMKKVMSPAGWQVSSQEKKKYLFDNSKSFALKPDIVMKRYGRIVILDTKWKELDGKENGSNYGISQADLANAAGVSRQLISLIELDTASQSKGHEALIRRAFSAVIASRRRRLTGWRTS